MSSRRILLMSCLVAVLTANTVGAEPPKPKDGPLGMKFVPLPKGTFYMGWDGDEGTAMKTEIKEDFEIAVYTVTQGQWQELMGNNPSCFSRDGEGKDKVKDIKDEDLKQFPVEQVSWNDAQEFIKKLNEQEKGKGWMYRLPTEAEWEYACRGGATSEEECSYHFYFAKPTNDLSSKEANFNGDYPDGKARQGAVPGTHDEGGFVPAEQAGAVRHARQRLAVVRAICTNRDPWLACCVAGAGTPTARAAGRRTASGTSRAAGTRTSGSAWPQFLRLEPSRRKARSSAGNSTARSGWSGGGCRSGTQRNRGAAAELPERGDYNCVAG